MKCFQQVHCNLYICKQIFQLLITLSLYLQLQKKTKKKNTARHAGNPTRVRQQPRARTARVSVGQRDTPTGRPSVNVQTRSCSRRAANQSQTAMLIWVNEPRREKNRSLGFPTRSDTNRPAHSKKTAESLKFLI